MTAGQRVLDVLVVGGGPVGLFAAIQARRRDLSVAVVEPRPGPIDKACGEGLMPTAVERLAAVGVDVAGRTFVGIRYSDGRRQVAARFRGGSGRGVRRTTLHAALAARAEALGVERFQARVTEVEQCGDVVRAAGLTARWLLGADGLHSSVRRELGVATASRAVHRYGLRRHYALRPWTDHVEVYWSRTAEAYVTPVADDLVGVAVLTGAGTPFEQALEGFPALRARLRGAGSVTDVRGAGPLRQSVTAVHRGRVLLVGDAAGYVDALTGEGLSTGFSSATAAVAAVAAGRPHTYPHAWAVETRRARLLTAGLLGITSRAWPRAALVPVAANAPNAFAAVVHLLR